MDSAKCAFLAPCHLPLRPSSLPRPSLSCARRHTPLVAVASPPRPRSPPSPSPSPSPSSPQPTTTPATPSSSPLVSIDTTEAFLSEMGDASAASRPAVVFFHAGYCRACKAVLPKVARMAGEFGESVAFAEVCVEKSPGLAMRLGVRRVPSVHVYDGDKGKVDEFNCGMMGVKRLRSIVERLAGVTGTQASELGDEEDSEMETELKA